MGDELKAGNGKDGTSGQKIDMLNLLADVSLSAAEGGEKKRPKISGVAYNGGMLDVGYYRPVIIALDGLEIPETIPLLADHENTVNSKIGEVTARIENGKVVFEGVITAESFTAQNIIQQHKNGSKWQVSIGAKAIVMNCEEEGTVNGITFGSETYVARKSILREISIIPVGADKDTSTSIEARANQKGLAIPIIKATGGVENNKNGEEQMDDELKNKDNKGIVTAGGGAGVATGEQGKQEHAQGAQGEQKPVNAEEIKAKAVEQERQRVNAIGEICGDDAPEIKAKAIKEGWDAAKTSQEVLNAIRAKRPQISIIDNGNVAQTDAIEAALCLNIGVDEKYLDNKKALEIAAKQYNGLGIRDAVRIIANMNGGKFTTTTKDCIRASFGSTLTNLLGNIANKQLIQAFDSYQAFAPQICRVGSAQNYLEHKTLGIIEGDENGLAEVPASGENTGQLTQTTLSEKGGSTTAKIYGNYIRLSEYDITNDSLDAFSQIASLLGVRSAMSLDSRTLAVMTNKANGFWDTINGSNIWEAVSEGANDFGFDNLETAWQAFTAMSNYKPRFLVVPSAYELDANKLIGSQEVRSTIDGVTYPTKNFFYNKLTVIPSKLLTAGWFLVANPAECPAFDLRFVGGERKPRVETGTESFTNLSITWRVTYRFGVGWIMPEGAYYCAACEESSSSSASA